MNGLAAVLLLAAAVAERPRGAGSLPERADRRYRVEIGGEPVGWASLSIRCADAGCAAVWRSELRAPADAGGEIMERRIELETARDGTGIRTRSWQRDGRGQRLLEAGAGPVPASLAETVLSGLALTSVPAPATAADNPRCCLELREEGSGRTGMACAARARDGAWFDAEVLGVEERFRAVPGEPPDEVLLPGQRTRFIADESAALPARPPRLFGVAVPETGAGPARRFCGLAPEPPPGPLPARLPPADAPGSSCREKTAGWLSAAAQAGLAGRHVVGLAHDGTTFVWHEWAEVQAGGGWVPVDPSFRQAPARGPRFAVARFAAGDLAAQAEAGARVLACWGAALR